MAEIPQVLQPYRREEAISVAEAAEIANKSAGTIRQWCALYDLGRRVGGGAWQLSRVALAMHLDGNRGALKAYLSGVRAAPLVASYFIRLGIPLPPPEPQGSIEHQEARAA